MSARAAANAYGPPDPIAVYKKNIVNKFKVFHATKLLGEPNWQPSVYTDL